VIRELSTDTPLLATTATANNRVIEDLCEQLGDEVYISRGPLTRESLSIRLLHMPSRAERYGWILENINKLNGSGIIYCLTRRDCDYLADFLTKNGVSAVAYYSDLDRDEINTEAERKFENNEIKAIVATIKLGMGYDKGDVSFIIHYQMPSGIVSYYQQIGRAGRSIPNADVFLMYGKEDMTIIDYFIDTIFPLKEDVDAIMALCKSEERVKARKIERELNISKRRIERTLEYLLANDIITLDRHAYSLTGKELSYDREKYDAIEAQRRAEAEQMRALATHKGCYSKYIVNCLDDFSAEDCGKCGFCNPKHQISDTVSLEFKEKASHYINRLVLEITPRKMWAVSEQMPSSKIEFVNQEGICLCEYSEVGYGELVRRAIEGDTYFPPELLGKSAELLLPLIKEKEITHLAYVPSKRSDRVAEFASRLAKRCAIELICPLEAKDAPRQCEMENGAHKCENALNAFLVKTENLPEKIILLDDTVDSKWTLTVCGYKLMEKGATEIYPFVLAHKGEKQ
jgi:ATP-dependent DNA helicase RecQ